MDLCRPWKFYDLKQTTNIIYLLFFISTIIIISIAIIIVIMIVIVIIIIIIVIIIIFLDKNPNLQMDWLADSYVSISRRVDQ